MGYGVCVQYVFFLEVFDWRFLCFGVFLCSFFFCNICRNLVHIGHSANAELPVAAEETVVVAGCSVHVVCGAVGGAFCGINKALRGAGCGGGGASWTVGARAAGWGIGEDCAGGAVVAGGAGGAAGCQCAKGPRGAAWRCGRRGSPSAVIPWRALRACCIL